MAMKPWIPVKRNTVQNAATQAKEGEWPKQIPNAVSRATYGPTKTPVVNAATQRNKGK